MISAACRRLAAPTLALLLIGAAPKPAMLPARTLDCTLGRMTNPDPTRQQTEEEIVYEGQHRFVLHLAAVPVRTAPPPDAIDPPEPVDRRTRIVADPDGLRAKFPRRFDRVVDYWPDRVELTTTIDDPLVNMIIVNPIDPARGTAMLFMAQATDVATYDMTRLFRGRCTVAIG